MKFRNLILAIAVLAIAGTNVFADTVHDEYVDGDLSDNNLNPTALIFGIGQNDVSGSTTPNPNLDRDFWTFEIADNYLLDSVELLEYETTENRSFFAVAQGGSVQSVTSAGGLLGTAFVGAGDLNTDVLDNLGNAGLGGTGFSGPLGPGQYTFWYQETAADTDYSFRFNVSAVPEPSSMLALGLVTGLAGLRRRRK